MSSSPTALYYLGHCVHVGTRVLQDGLRGSPWSAGVCVALDGSPCFSFVKDLFSCSAWEWHRTDPLSSSQCLC